MSSILARSAEGTGISSIGLFAFCFAVSLCGCAAMTYATIKTWKDCDRGWKASFLFFATLSYIAAAVMLHGLGRAGIQWQQGQSQSGHTIPNANLDMPKENQE